jgi:protein Mpv17
MVLEIPRRKFFRTINSKYIYGRVVSVSRRVLSPVIGGVCQQWQIPKTGLLVLIHFSRQPLVHTVIFLIEMAILGRLAAKFNSYYADRPGTIYTAMEDEVTLIPLQCSR